ncbi:sterol desaturase family protein [Pseudomonas sp. HK3]
MYSHVKGLGLYNLRNSLSCLACGAFTTTVEVFTKALLLLVYAYLFEHFAITKHPDDSWITWIAALVVFDFLWYWAHRVSHEMNILWGGHLPHHQSEEFNLTAGLRQGALQDVMYWPIYMLMAPLGFSPEMFITHMLINKFYGFWLHTRTINKIPLIEGILATPSAHRVHHGMNDIYIDKNYGGIFMVFDRIFGTYQAETCDVIYGVRKPCKTYNPISVHFEWLYCLWQDACLTKRYRDKIKIWFMPTGWRPKDIEQSQPRVKRDLSGYVKFDSHRPSYDTGKMLVIFAVFSTLAQCLLFAGDVLSWPVKILLAVSITIGFLWLGRVLDASVKHRH